MALVRAKAAGGSGIASGLLEPLESRLLLSTVPSWVSVGPGGGGSFFNPSISPYNASEIYTPSDMGGLYHTTDSGATWQVMDWRQAPGQRQTAVQFTNVPGTLFYLNGSQPIKSTNGGATWTSVGSNGSNVLYVDYNNPNRWVLGAWNQYNPDDTYTCGFYFTSNGGSSYSSITVASHVTAPNGNDYMAGAWFDGANIYVATGNSVWYSTNSGGSFSKYTTTGIAAGEGIVSFAAAKRASDGATRFFIVTNPIGDISGGFEGDCYHWRNIYSTDPNATTPTWTSKTSGVPSDAKPQYVVMANGNIDTVYIGGGSNASAMSVIKTTNGGTTWTSVFKYTNNQNIQTGWQGDNNDSTWSFPEYAFGVAVAPNDVNTVIMTDMGGAHITTDGGTTWRAVYDTPADLNPVNVGSTKNKAYRSSGLDDTTIWGVTWADENTLFGSYTDIHAGRSTDGGLSWQAYYTSPTIPNTTYGVALQPTTGYLFSAVSTVHDIYEAEEFQRDGRIDAGTGSVLRSTDKGATWTSIHNFGHPVVWITIDPNNPNRAFVSVANYDNTGTPTKGDGIGGIYVSSDINLGTGSHWYKLNNPPRTEGHPWNIVLLNDGSMVATYAMRWTPDATYSASSGVFYGTNYNDSTHTITWTDTVAGTPEMQYAVHDITIDPSDPTQNTWWAGVWDTTQNLYYPGGIFKTTNRGATWTEVPTGFSGWQQKAWSQITFNPLNNNEAYITTNGSGLWYGTNMHAATPTFTQVADYPFVHPMRVVYNPYQPREVWITSFGNGLRYGINTTGLLPGDSNMDGSVTFADYQILEANFGKKPLSWKAGDFNGDQAVTFADYQLLEANFGKSNLAAPSSLSSEPLALSAAAPLAAATLSATSPTPAPARSLPLARSDAAGRFVGIQAPAVRLDKPATTSVTSELDLIDARWTKKLRKPQADDASLVDLLASPLL